MHNNREFKRVQAILKKNPGHYIGLLFCGVNYRKIGQRIYFDAPQFDSWDYNLSTNICKDFRDTTDKSYDMISLYAHFFTHNDQGKALREIKSKIGDDGDGGGDLPLRSNQTKPDRLGNTQSSDQDKRKARRVLEIWKEAMAADGTIVETYLNNRGIVFDGVVPPTIRYHRSLIHRETGKKYEAMVCAICIYPNNKIIGLHITFLENGQKAQIDPEKKLRGKVSGGAIRLTHLSNPLIIGEGIETVLSAASTFTDYAVWIALSASGVINVILPPPDIVSDVYILVDNDKVGIGAARDKAIALTKLGHVVRLCYPDDCGDFNDLIRRQ